MKESEKKKNPESCRLRTNLFLYISQALDSVDGSGFRLIHYGNSCFPTPSAFLFPKFLYFLIYGLLIIRVYTRKLFPIFTDELKK